MRILVVDDEVVSRTKMHVMMESLGESQMAENGTQAIEMFRQAMKRKQAFDLVTLDIQMPDLQGTEVLKQLRAIEGECKVPKEQQSVVMMVTSQSDKIQVLTSIALGCDEYITKPFNFDTIRGKLAKLGLSTKVIAKAPTERKDPGLSADTIYKRIQSALRAGDLTLPVLPQISIKFREMVRINSDLEQMAELLKQDMVISSKLIRAANSAMYRGYGLVNNVEQAMGRLGISTTEKLVNVATNRRLYVTDNQKYSQVIGNLWQHSLASAFSADLLAQSLDHKLVIDPFTAGLLHDIGSLALIQIIAEMEKQKHFPQEISHGALLDTVSRYHAVFGAKLLKKWNFGPSFTDTALCHNNLEKADSQTTEILVIHLGNRLAKASGYATFDQIEVIDLDDAPSANELQVDASKLAKLQQEVQLNMVASVEPSSS